MISIRAYLKKLISRIARLTSKDVLTQDLLKKFDEITAVDKGMQILLALKYKELMSQGGKLPELNDVEFRAFSQNGEDGILLYLFSLIGTTNKTCVEICAGDGIQCNSANLIVNHGWTGLLFDGDEKNADIANNFYGSNLDTRAWPPTFVNAWITRENVNDLIATHGVEGEIDLLSLDLDGVDWWIWKQIDIISPRVVVVEYNNLMGPDRSCTVPYADDFISEITPNGRDYASASLSAFVKLGKDKGYRLVGVQRYGYNAFFIRDDLGKELLPTIFPANCFDHPFSIHAMNIRSKNIEERSWIEI